jgi:hypothetical protein
MDGTGTFLAAALCAVILAGLPGPAEAQWKWRDANGRITVSDLPPPRNIPPQDILSSPEQVAPPRLVSPASAAGASAPEASSAPKVDADLQARKQAAEEAEAQRVKSDAERTAARRAENCRNARSHLAALSTGQRIARFNAQGEREILDDKQRASESRRAEQVISSDCR